MTGIKLKITLSVTDDLDVDEIRDLSRLIADGAPVLADIDIGYPGDAVWIVDAEAHIVAVDDGYGLHLKGKPFEPSTRTIDGDTIATHKQIEST